MSILDFSRLQRRSLASRRACKRAWPLTLLLTLLASMPAQAIDYVAPFDGRSFVPLGCVTLLGSTTCIFPIILAIGDTLKLGSGVIVNGDILSSTGNITLGDNVQVKGTVFTSTGNITMGNRGKVSSKVESSTGSIILGDDVTIGANVFSTTGSITLGANAIVNTSIQSSTGPIILGENVSVKQGVNSTTGPITLKSGHVMGNVGATTGFITIGNGTRIDGSITHSEVGNIILGQGVIVKGGIASADTTTVIGDGSEISGSINNSSTGNVTLQKNVQVGGQVSVITGSADIGYGSQVIGNVTAITGNVRVGDYARVVGIATATTGDVDIGNYGQVCGYATVTTGAITIGHHGRVGSYVTVTTGKVAIGAVTAGDDVQIGGYVAVTTGSVTFGNAGQVGTYIALTTGDTKTGAVTFGDNGRVGGAVSITTGYLVTGSNFKSSDTTLVISSTCAAIAAPSPLPVTVTNATFDALETGIVWSSVLAAQNRLYTKLAGTAFSFDIAALKTDRTLESAYVAAGGIARHVKLELFDDSSAECSAHANPVAVQTTSFTSTQTSSVAGRTPSGTITVPDAHRSLLVRIKECVDSTCNSFTSNAPACSSDRFAVRPPALILSAAMATGAAPSPAAAQVIKAGADFTLSAGNNPIGTYRGTLTLDPSKLSAQLPSEGTLVQSGGIVGALTPSILTANTATSVSYSEVGYLYIGIGAYRDDSFTAVDSAVGDCITSSASNNDLSDVLIDGKYGCSIGNRTIASLGRFVPHHFSTQIAKDAIMACPKELIDAGKPCPLAGFVYSRQPFPLTITARSLDGLPTRNYSGLLAHEVELEAWSAPGMQTQTDNQNPLTMIPALAIAAHGALDQAPVTAIAFKEGVANAISTYAFPAQYLAQYPATKLAAPTDIYLRATEKEGNGVTSLRDDDATASIEAGIKVGSGRIHVANNYGSQLLAVPVIARAQYWNGMRFVNSSTDQNTFSGSLDVVFKNCKKDLIAAGGQASGLNCKKLTVAAAASAAIKNGENGQIRLLLAAPGNTGSVDLNISTFDWLPSTIARIGVGIYKAGPIIYIREMY